MLDFVKIEKYLHSKDTLLFENLKWLATYSDGTQRFSVANGFNPLKVLWSDETGHLIVEGSLPYYWQGHNFNFPNETFYQTIENIEFQTGLNLFDADVTKFEFGKILKVQMSPCKILNRHSRLKGFVRTQYEKGVYFENKTLKVKMYDAGYRMKTASKPLINSLNSSWGFEPDQNYLRFENHYKKPQIHFKCRSIKLETLLTDSFQAILKNDLMATYQAIEKIKPLEIPNDKKLLNSSTIPLIVLKSLEQKFGIDVKREIDDFLKSIPKEILPQNDRKQRKRQINTNLKKITSTGGILLDYDLTSEIELAFS